MKKPRGLLLDNTSKNAATVTAKVNNSFLHLCCIYKIENISTPICYAHTHTRLLGTNTVIVLCAVSGWELISRSALEMISYHFSWQDECQNIARQRSYYSTETENAWLIISTTNSGVNNTSSHNNKNNKRTGKYLGGMSAINFTTKTQSVSPVIGLCYYYDWQADRGTREAEFEGQRTCWRVNYPIETKKSKTIELTKL